jgi:AcrR family transcriptional regulator
MARMDSEQRKKQILECAKKLFARKGYYQTQISDIQHEAGVARGTIYQYFKNKDDIFKTLLENLHKEMKDVISSKPANLEEDFSSGEKVFRYRIKKAFALFANDPDYCNLLLRVGLGLGDSFDSILGRFDRQMVELIKSYLVSGIKLGRVKPDIDPVLMSNVIGGGFMRMAYFYGVTGKGSKTEEFEQLTENFVNAFAYGIFLEKP